MIRKIVRKELLENINSLRFVLSLLLIVSVFMASGFVFVNRYKYQVEDYRNETNKNFSALSKRADNLSKIAFYKQAIYRKPRVLEFCAEGYEKSLPNMFKTNVFSVDYPELRARSNFLLPRFSDIDLVFIISFILSFVALLLTFDSVSGEKEAGTLQLMLSNPIPRDKVLLAKYLGAMLTLGIPLFLGMAINLIIVNSSSMISISGGEWLKILVAIVVSLFYLSIFVWLGILVSSRTARSSTTMVILLLLWATLVMIIPSCGRIVADKFHSIPDRTEIDRRIADARQQIIEEHTRPPSKAGFWADNPFDEWVPARSKMVNEITATRNQIFDSYINQMVMQVNSGRNFTRISPTAIYQYVSEAIIGTGVDRFANLYTQIKRYKEILKNYILDKDKGDPDSPHLLNEWHSVCISQKPVDFKSIPQFEERDLPLGASLHQAILDIGLLLLFNVVFFMGAFVSFLRYDVR